MFDKPETALRFHLHVDENMQETMIESDQFEYFASCLRQACVMAKRLQCTVWFEDVFQTYSLHAEVPVNLYINPRDEYDRCLDLYYKNLYKEIKQVVDLQTLRKLGLDGNYVELV